MRLMFNEVTNDQVRFVFDFINLSLRWSLNYLLPKLSESQSE